MTIWIIVFGALTLVTGIVIISNPDIVFGFLKKNAGKLEVHILAVVVRLVLGVLLIHQSGASRYPLAIEIIGWLSTVAALSFAVIGRSTFMRLITWALSLDKPFGRVGGAIAICFGAFLIHAFV
jgi:hypothetical protein